MAARHDKSDIGRREIIAPDVSIALPRHFRSNKMPNQMMDADEGKIVCVGERLREGEPHEQRPDETRPRSDGESIQIGEPKARFRQRRGNDLRNDANMIPTRKLRHDATVGRMHALLPMHGARHDLATAAKNRRGHLITRTLDP